MEKPFGDRLNEMINDTRGVLFLQGEMAQLTYISYEKFIESINSDESETIPITYPIGLRPDNTLINRTRDYTKQELIERYQLLALDKLPIDGILKLVTLMETLLNDILRKILIEYPSKIPNKRKIDVEKALNATSLEEIKLYIVDNILNDIAYKSPKDYADEFNTYVGVNLLENPIFHKYIELKATRDIHIHNNGIANEIYRAKSGVMARINTDAFLPVTVQYFLQSYECCLQLNELIEVELDKIWPSQEYRKGKTKASSATEEKESVDEKAIEESTKQKETEK
ncbi:hypothetical protein ABV409_11900 [Flagellimonas sp. DF-77]|uniref:hypothetical protein n=1 Tax=Flagellimonas algarum TaxID=3230298 RepID=UPI003395804C